jgi:two-component system sensor histidine kinase UhpB
VSLFWRVLLVNAGLLVLAAGILLFSPVTISSPVRAAEVAIVIAGLVAGLVTNVVLLRPGFASLERLSRRMEDVDLLRPGQRLPAAASPEVARLISAFNAMLDRLEAERRTSGRRALVAQEQERLRIARGLHDQVGQTMTGVLLQLQRLSDRAPEDLRAEIGETQDAVREGLDEVRRIAQELRPETLDHLGLPSALEALATSFSRRTGLEVERSVDPGLPHLDPEAELAVYRVAQEGLTNVARHAGARHVRLSLTRGEGSVVLSLVDDGRGVGDGLVEGGGLRGMRERALMVGAALVVRPAREGGLEVWMEVPAAPGG